MNKNIELKFPGYDKEVGNRLREAVQLIGSNRKVGHLVGATDTQVGRWLSGKSKIPLYAAALIAKAANVSLDWLVTGKVIAPTPKQEATPIVGNGDSHAGYQDEPPFNSAVMEKVTEAFLDWQDANPIADPAPNSHQGQALTGTYRVIMKEFVREGRIDLDAIKGRVTTIFDYLLEND